MKYFELIDEYRWKFTMGLGGLWFGIILGIGLSGTGSWALFWGLRTHMRMDAIYQGIAMLIIGIGLLYLSYWYRKHKNESLIIDTKLKEVGQYKGKELLDTFSFEELLPITIIKDVRVTYRNGNRTTITFYNVYFNDWEKPIYWSTTKYRADDVADNLRDLLNK